MYGLKILVLAAGLMFYAGTAYNLSMAYAGEANGKVVRVIDGDTLVVILTGGRAEKVRLKGIDTPEIDEPFYEEATRFAKEMAGGRNVKLITTGRGDHGRLLAYVMVNGKSLNLQLVRSGLARVYKGRFAPKNRATYKRYLKAQEEAIAQNLGIWKKGR